MNLKCIPLNKEVHFPTMQRWWESRGFVGAKPEFLPSKGAMILHDDRPVFGAFLIETNANTAIIDYGASDPEASSEVRNSAFDLCFRELWELAGMIGFDMVCASSNLKDICNRYEDFGLIKADENVTIFGGLTCHKLL